MRELTCLEEDGFTSRETLTGFMEVLPMEFRNKSVKKSRSAEIE